jgi:hypothetical protein
VIIVTVEPPVNVVPQVAITAPLNGVTVKLGMVLSFTGTASDAEDGRLTGDLVWSSSIDGWLGNGAAIQSTLTEGVRTITSLVPIQVCCRVPMPLPLNA